MPPGRPEGVPTPPGRLEGEPTPPGRLGVEGRVFPGRPFGLKLGLLFPGVEGVPTPGRPGVPGRVVLPGRDGAAPGLNVLPGRPGLCTPPGRPGGGVP